VQEERLPGGRTTDVVRIGETVHRPTRSWTPAVQAVLRHLEAAGFADAPRVLGVDDLGREVLSYVPGETVGEVRPWPRRVFADETLAQVGSWMRRLHDATATFVPTPDLTWLAGQGWQPGLVIGHNDAAPYNAVWRDGRLAGFVDWDTAGPSSRERDLAFTALWWVPLQPRRIVEALGFDAFGDRSRRLHLLLDAYGYQVDRSTFGTEIATRARINAAVVRRMAAGGDPTFVALLPMAATLEEAAHDVESLPGSFWTRPGGSTRR
jgi:hypothetical protein